MVTAEVIVTLPPVPAGFSGFEIVGKLHGHPCKRVVESAGAAVQRSHFGEHHTDETVAEGGERKREHNLDEAMAAAKAGSDDYYALLGLGHLRIKATTEQIRAAHRDLVVHLHPDTQKAEHKNDENDDEAAAFKMLTKAFETLSVPQLRLIYDSKVGPDIKRPGKSGDYFARFGPMFKAAGYYSVKTPVPELGDDNTPNDEVDEFYSFWFKYESWRDFSFAAEHDLSAATDRDERRWMEVENKRKAKSKKREEMQNIHSYVEQAYKEDPRIRRRKEQERREKEARIAAAKQAEQEVETRCFH